MACGSSVNNGFELQTEITPLHASPLRGPLRLYLVANIVTTTKISLLSRFWFPFSLRKRRRTCVNTHHKQTSMHVCNSITAGRPIFNHFVMPTLGYYLGSPESGHGRSPGRKSTWCNLSKPCSPLPSGLGQAMTPGSGTALQPWNDVAVALLPGCQSSACHWQLEPQTPHLYFVQSPSLHRSTKLSPRLPTNGGYAVQKARADLNDARNFQGFLTWYG
ncbi:hypothetical protein QBC44DRAFT_391021 [Cladorrhinum sp. PSN332]|nr:hypothetical protein QBC44DRAFT_391021 [Cladorrhinum sp. PSN332]